MDLVLIEIVLWVGLLFFFWALKEGLGHVESDIESLGLLQNGRQPLLHRGSMHFDRPERVAERIGTYRDVPIYRFAVICGQEYQFDRVCPPDSGMALRAGERCLEPGLVYQASPTNSLPADQA